MPEIPNFNLNQIQKRPDFQTTPNSNNDARRVDEPPFQEQTPVEDATQLNEESELRTPKQTFRLFNTLEPQLVERDGTASTRLPPGSIFEADA